MTANSQPGPCCAGRLPDTRQGGMKAPAEKALALQRRSQTAAASEQFMWLWLLQPLGTGMKGSSSQFHTVALSLC